MISWIRGGTLHHDAGLPCVMTRGSLDTRGKSLDTRGKSMDTRGQIPGYEDLGVWKQDLGDPLTPTPLLGRMYLGCAGICRDLPGFPGICRDVLGFPGAGLIINTYRRGVRGFGEFATLGPRKRSGDVLGSPETRIPVRIWSAVHFFVGGGVWGGVRGTLGDPIFWKIPYPYVLIINPARGLETRTEGSGNVG